MIASPSLCRFRSVFLIFVLHASIYHSRTIEKRSFTDQSIKGFSSERICWWNEVCKEEFQTLFRCRCPQWSYCRSPGRYYNAICSITGTGYIWTQPESTLTRP